LYDSIAALYTRWDNSGRIGRHKDQNLKLRKEEREEKLEEGPRSSFKYREAVAKQDKVM
jgi:hypothetical protein